MSCSLVERAENDDASRMAGALSILYHAAVARGKAAPSRQPTLSSAEHVVSTPEEIVSSGEHVDSTSEETVFSAEDVVSSFWSRCGSGLRTGDVHAVASAACAASEPQHGECAVVVDDLVVALARHPGPAVARASRELLDLSRVGEDRGLGRGAGGVLQALLLLDVGAGRQLLTARQDRDAPVEPQPAEDERADDADRPEDGEHAHGASAGSTVTETSSVS